MKAILIFAALVVAGAVFVGLQVEQPKMIQFDRARLDNSVSETMMTWADKNYSPTGHRVVGYEADSGKEVHWFRFEKN